ncbi:hypothetical protein BDZ91DRAFT_517983 [Kalaharituber pfeilii]|nr:hypothetical protein BDZ91DRAFT_517983 [Kalaharituber pfeilii]
MSKDIHLPNHPFHTDTGRVYQGELNWGDGATNDLIVVIFHNTVAVAQPVSFYLQFSGWQKKKDVYDYRVYGMEQTEHGYKLHIKGEKLYYSFTAEMNERSMALQMFNPKGETNKPGTLDLVWPRK